MSSAARNDAPAPLSEFATPRLAREYRTLAFMMADWCRHRHPDAAAVAGSGLCADCHELLAYAGQRLEKCPYGEDKPTCANCPVHCYRKVQRERMREVMKFGGPRLMFSHPWLAIRHVLDGRRRVSMPLAHRRGAAAPAAEPDAARKRTP